MSRPIDDQPPQPPVLPHGPDQRQTHQAAGQGPEAGRASFAGRPGSIQDALDALKHGATARLSHGVALDPLHAVYVAVQNVTSVFAERVSQFPEFEPYYQVGVHGRGRLHAGRAADEPADGQLLHHLGVLRPAVRTRRRDDRDLPARRGRAARAGAGRDRGDPPDVRDPDGRLRARRGQGRAVPAPGVDHGRRVRVLRPGGVSRKGGRTLVRAALPAGRARWPTTSPSRRPTS